MNRRTVYAAMTRAAILNAALELFVTRGFESTTVDDIAELADVSKGAVYHHFRDKSEMFVEVYRDSTRSVLTGIARMVQMDDRSAWERAEDGVRMVMRTYVTDPVACVLFRQAQQALGAERLQSIHAETALPIIRGLVGELDAAGELVPVDLESTVQLVFLVLCEAATLITLHADPAAASRSTEPVVLRLIGGLRNPLPR
ncbi:helix-turn-helix domain-containing protein [Nocardia sp. NPDC005825]|uniref:TetR/AcrR family transcriptional regulator n=1 Tax=unclassified Nocardia TaxID=2637762 RepID=UPI0033CE2936